MKVKKVLSLLALVFWIIFLVIPAFSGDEPVDADPWNEAGGILPEPDDIDRVIIIIDFKFGPLAPRFVMLKVQIPSTPQVAERSSFTQARGSSPAGR